MRRKKASAKVRRTEKLIQYFQDIKEITDDGQFMMLKGVLLMEHPFSYPEPDRTVVEKCFDGVMIAERLDELNAKMMSDMGYVRKADGGWRRGPNHSRGEEKEDALDRLVEQERAEMLHDQAANEESPS